MPRISTSINGTPTVFATVETTAVEAIRNDIGLTGTKVACGHGACGACVVLLDGTPAASCLLPVEDLEGRDVRTVEGVGGDDLHPVQRAFIAHDGMQCGFCTPGFIVESMAFYEAWRRRHGAARPSRDDVAKGLAGHLCRCAAYEGIYAAVQAACVGEHDAPTDIGGARPDAREKVTGAAKYTFDLESPGMQHGCIVRSTIAHGDVRKIDPSAALDVAGVTGFVELIDEKRRIRYLGQPIAAVAAVDERTASEAAALVRITYVENKAVFDIPSALARGAPAIHRFRWMPPNNNEGRELPNIRWGNRRGPNLFASHRPIKATRTIDRIREENPTAVIEGRWTASVQIHTPLEPHVTIAHWPSFTSLVVHTSTQGITVMRNVLAKQYTLNAQDVEVRAAYVGGAFGGKQMPDADVFAAVQLAWATGTPVKVAFDRKEELSYAGYRPGAEMELTVAAENGGMAAVSMSAWAHGGAAAGQLIASIVRFNYHKIPHRLADYDVVTNLPPGKAFRAPGGPLTAWSLEQALDELAERLDIDPISLREKSHPEPLRQRVYDATRTSALWQERRTKAKTGRFRRGIGAAFSSWIYVLDPDTDVTVEADASGVLRVVAAAQDMGNGTRGVLAHAVADVFGVSPGAVVVDIGDSGAGHGPLSSGSRTTASVWPAARDAAVGLRGELMASLRSQGMRGLTAIEGGVRHKGELIGWAEVVARTGPMQRTAKRPPDARVPLWRRSMNWALLRTSITHGEPGHGHTEGGTIVEVEVDTLLGRVRPLRAHGIIAAGTIHSPPLATSQVSGGIVQGLGYALYEERRIHPGNGLNLTSNLEDYHVPGIGDTPEITVEFIEGGFDDVPGGGVGLSELATVAVAAATGNAVANATGVRHRHLPIRPDRITGAAS